MVQGSGNKMEVRLVDAERFDAFCTLATKGRELPKFQNPQPVPESFEQLVLQVFQRARTREIPTKIFCDLWKCFLPTVKLQCKDFGYRDIKGLLANTSIVEKIGGKHNSRYVL